MISILVRKKILFSELLIFIEYTTLKNRDERETI